MKKVKSLARGSLGVIPLLVALSGCDSPGAGVPRHSVRDSLGIRIVESLEPGALNETWRPSPNPLVRIGWDASGPEFHNVYSGQFLPDGGFVVADAGANQVYHFSRSGSLTSILGAPGEGPGEFARISSVLVLGGDSVLVQDSGNQRVSLFVEDSFVSDWRFGDRLAGAWYEILLRTHDGRFALVPRGFRVEGTEEAGWATFPLLSASRDFARIDTIVGLDMIRWKEPGNRNPVRQYGYALRAGDRVAHLRTHQPEVRWLNPDGTPAQIVRWNAPVQEADEEVWAGYERWYRGLRPDADLVGVERRLGDARRDFGGALPYFGMVHGDQSGNVWLGTYTLPVLHAAEYLVVTSDGNSAHLIEFPEQLRILDITAEHVLAVAQNDLDVQSVVVYQLEKPGR